MIMTLTDIAQDIKTRLIEGGARRKSAFHTLVVGTADNDLRVMVLREFDAGCHTLRFHTDARSPKVAAIADNPSVSVLAYDQDAKIQIRMRGTARVEASGDAADAAWAQSTNFAKRCYLAEAAPSSTSAQPTSGLPEWAEGINPNDEQITVARQNFAILLVDVREFDWLYLANDGHKRARIVLDNGQPKMTWLVP